MTRTIYLMGGMLLAMLLSLFNQGDEPKTIVCWGDSLTASHAGSKAFNEGNPDAVARDDSYPACLQRGLGQDYKVINCGIGGENTLTIMARQGAYPMQLAHDVKIFTEGQARYPKFIGNSDVSAFVSSYNGSPVTPLIQDSWESGSAAGINPCTIDGKEYTLLSDAHFWIENGGFQFEYNYYIKSDGKQPKTEVLKKGSTITTQAMQKLRGAYANVFFMGQNGGFKTVAELIDQYRAMIDYSQSPRYVIIGFHTPNGVIPTVERMQQMEDSLSQAFGRNYINLRNYMVKQGLQDAQLTATDADKEALMKGMVPPQLIPDGCHFTSKGYQLIADLVQRRFKELGY